jgi:PKD repeat protein
VDSCSITARFQYYKDSLDCKKIHFINYSAPISPNVHFAWNFGDGSSSTDISPVHAYAQQGTYVISLVSEAGVGCRKQVWDTVIVKCTDTCSYTTGFSWRADSLAAGKIYFTNLSQPATAGIHYAWNFGDSSAQSHDISPSHMYAHTGKYTVCLVAELGSNCRKVYCLTIEVKEINPCTAKALFGYYKLNWMPLTIRLEAINQGDSTQYHWSFGDSSYGSGRLTTHSFPKAGWYNVCLYVVKGKCSVVGCQPVFVADSVLNLPQMVPAIPNPAINSVTINVTLDRPETVIIRILDGTGVIKAVISKYGTTGNNRFTLPVERLSRGLYLVEIHTSTRQWFSRFQKG